MFTVKLTLLCALVLLSATYDANAGVLTRTAENNDIGAEKTRMCDFESSLSDCGYSLDSRGDFHWTLYKGATPSLSTGPSFDHTHGTSAGQYVYMEATDRKPGERAVMRTAASLDPRDAYEVDFWYHMYSHMGASGELVVYYVDKSNQPHNIWSRAANAGNRWRNAVVRIPEGATGLMFEGIRGQNGLSDIALDDVKILCRRCAYENPFDDSPTDVPSTTTPDGSTEILQKCNFDTDLCGFTQSQTDSFDWTRGQGSTPSSGTGPTADHTSGAGHYIYTETSNPRKQDETTILISRDLPQGTNKQLGFWYHMQGQHIGTLNIRAILDGQTQTRLVWTKTGSQNTKWTFTEQIKLPDNTVRVQFESIVGGGYQGDIAIDDVVISCGSCGRTTDGVSTQRSPTTLRIQPTSTTSEPTVTTTKTSMRTGSLPLSCDFESGWCGLTRSTSDNMHWTLQQGTTPSGGTGPTQDHTHGNAQGYYVYIEASSKPIGTTATLTYSLQKATQSPYCIRFSYHMYGHHIGSLRVLVDTSLVKEIKGDLDRNKADHSWHEASVKLPVGSAEFSLVGVRGSDYQGDIALDDIRVTEGTC